MFSLLPTERVVLFGNKISGPGSISTCTIGRIGLTLRCIVHQRYSWIQIQLDSDPASGVVPSVKTTSRVPEF